MSITQKHLADKLGVTKNYLSALETNKREPSDTLIQLVNIFEENPEKIKCIPLVSSSPAHLREHFKVYGSDVSEPEHFETIEQIEDALAFYSTRLKSESGFRKTITLTTMEALINRMKEKLNEEKS